ncbi:Fur family transcriptional regulator [Candidatus Neomarinimicrobiota bacterium]
MNIQTSTLQRFKAALKAESLRLTPQRIAILADVLDSEDHRECDDILASLKQKNIAVSRATIYRTLDILHQAGFIRRLDVGTGPSRYENKVAQPHHDHMICLNCGKILEFVDMEVEARQVQISKDHDFQLSSHVHQLFGYCADCRLEKAID